MRCSISGYAVMFEEVLPAAWLSEIDPTCRQRSLGHIPVFWAWLAQVLEGNASCQKALGLIQAWYKASGLSVPAGNTSGYCQARLRLCGDFLEQISARVCRTLDMRASDTGLWQGLTLKAIDGTSVQLMDTPENQKEYPQPSTQKAGCGFPTMGVGVVVNLSHGGWEAMTTDVHSAHDAALAPSLLGHVGEGDLLLGDRAYCSYEIISTVLSNGGHALMRLHQARHKKLDWRKGKRIDENQRLVVWRKPVQPTRSTLSKEQWEALPEEIELRLIKVDYVDRRGRRTELVVVTTLVDHRRHCGAELSGLYARRWEVELRIRDIKTTLGMEFLTVKTPAMARRTMTMVMIAHNLLRVLMVEAATEAEKLPFEISFKSVLDLITSSHEGFRPLVGRPRLCAERRRWLVEMAATRLVLPRPGRREPRARKRRPKPYPLLTTNRSEYEEIPHRSKYRKAA